jgi:hypothetical protein
MKESERTEQEKMEKLRWLERERLRREYFDSQRKYIVEYRE